MTTALGLFASVIDGYLISMIIRRLNRDARLSQMRYILFIALFALTPVLLKSLIGMSTLSLFLSFALIIAIVSAFWGFNKYSFIACVVWIGIMIICEFLPVIPFYLIPDTTVLSVIQSDSVYAIMATIFSRFAEFTLIYALFNKNKDTKIASAISFSQLSLFVITFILLSCIMLGFFWAISGSPIPTFFAIIFMVCLISFLAVALFILNQIIKHAQEKEDTALMSMQADFYGEMQKTVEKYHILRHDYQHHLQALQTLLHSQNNKNADAYFSEVLQSYAGSTPDLIVNQPVVSSIITRKKEFALDNNIEFNLDIPATLNTDIQDTDLAVIFANLLDNAFEASMKTEDKYVNLTIEAVNDTIFIDISNSTLPVTFLEKGLLKSTKSAPMDHGYGLRSVKKLIAKYDGDLKMNYNSSKGEFTTSVSIPVSSSVDLAYNIS